MTAIARASLALSALIVAASLACGDGSAGDETPTATATAASTATSTATLGAGAPPVATETATAAPGGQQTYEVVEGDTLLGIAEQFGVSVDALAEANNITDPLLLQIGQELVIPSGDGAPGTAGGAGTATATATATPTAGGGG